MRFALPCLAIALACASLLAAVGCGLPAGDDAGATADGGDPLGDDAGGAGPDAGAIDGDAGVSNDDAGAQGDDAGEADDAGADKNDGGTDEDGGAPDDDAGGATEDGGATDDAGADDGGAIDDAGAAALDAGFPDAGFSCAADSCAHGVCSDVTEGVTCDCAGTGFTGPLCEENIDDCTAGTCTNGTCIDGINAVSCDCSAVDFDGPQCATPIDDCAGDPCTNGTCTDGLRAFTCDCAAVDFSGPLCATPIDDCAADPCGPGICDDGLRSFTCRCTGTGFDGDTCANNVDDCPGNACANGACIDGVNVYTCDCTGTGYSGALCDVNIDDCIVGACTSNGACTDLVNDFSCACAGAWIGDVCDDPANTLAGTYASCPDENFLNVSLYAGPGAPLPAPSLTVTCNASTMTTVGNNIPHHDYTDHEAFTLDDKTITFNIPLTLGWFDPPRQPTVVGTSGVAINGVSIGTPSASGGPLKYGDPALLENTSGNCAAHVNGQALHYHHFEPLCFFPDDDGTARSPVLGYMQDGYELRGPFDCLDAACAQVVEMKSSWTQTNDPTDCAYTSYAYGGHATDEESDGDEFLDECNGHFDIFGEYHYHMTDAYPWTTRCWRGNVGNQYLYGVVGTNDATFEARCSTGAYVP